MLAPVQSRPGRWCSIAACWTNAGGVGGVDQGVMSDGLDPHWLARLQALGKMQARYLWFLVIASIFYLGLSSGTLRPMNGVVKVPVLNLELDVAPILAAGPP